MTQDEKQLQHKDLCARLPYHTKISIYNDSWEGCQKGKFDTELQYLHIEAFANDKIEILPYLRPMSDMTEEEWSDFKWIAYEDCEYDNNGNPIHTESWAVSCDYIDDMIDFLNSHYLDYRNLIEKGLALKAPEGMYN